MTVEDLNGAQVTYPGTYVDLGEVFQHCFPKTDLASFTVNNQGPAWVGNVYITSSGRDFIGMTKCLNCDCKCGDRDPSRYEEHGCPLDCQNQQITNLGMSIESKIVGDTKCRNGENCKFLVSWEGQCY